MANIVPEFYGRFACKAGACRHSCCKGWEIDVDDETAAYYEQLAQDQVLGQGIGAQLSEAVYEDADGFHMVLQEDCCPFLEKTGLCRLILELGEDALCDICALHPRFFQEIGEDRLCGLGLSCEAVCALLLEKEEPLEFLVDDADVISMQGLLERLEPSGLDGVGVPAGALCFVPDLDTAYISWMLQTFLETEPIDQRWTEQMQELWEGRMVHQERARAYFDVFSEKLYDRIFSYILFRQLERIEETDEEIDEDIDKDIDEPEASEIFQIQDILEYARLSTMFVFWTDAVFGDLPEQLRRWSEQIEYSTDNVELLLLACCRRRVGCAVQVV